MAEVVWGIVGAAAVLVAQTGALFYWAGTISRTVKNNSREIADHEMRLRDIERVCVKRAARVEGR